MPLFSLLVSALAIFAGILFLLFTGSYLAYRLKRRSHFSSTKYL